MINRILRKLNPSALQKILRNCKILSHELGQWKSIKTGMCIDVSNNPIPWYTYPAIEYLSQLDLSKQCIFEYGAGNSSRFWGSRAKELISVEHNRAWFELVNKNKLNNQQIILSGYPFDYNYNLGSLLITT